MFSEFANIFQPYSFYGRIKHDFSENRKIRKIFGKCENCYMIRKKFVNNFGDIGKFGKCLENEKIFTVGKWEIGENRVMFYYAKLYEISFFLICFRMVFTRFRF